MNTEQRKAFHYEIKNWNNIPIGSQNCGVGCIFCKVNGDPALKRYAPLPAITLDDLYDGFNSLDPNYRFVRLGAGVLVAPHTDPYLHPDIYSFIQHTATNFPNKTVTTVTTGSYIDLDRLDDLWKVKNFGIDFSLITTQPIRETIIPYSTRDKVETLLKFAPIRKISLMFTGSVEDLKADIEHLLSIDLHMKCEQILVRRIEHTRFSPKKLLDLSYRSIGEYENAVRFLQENYPEIEYTIPYLDTVYDHPKIEYFEEAKNRLGHIISLLNSRPLVPFHLIMAESSYSYFQEKLKSFKNAYLYPTPNRTYGGSVTVSGLLTNQDIYSIFDQACLKEGVIVLPYEIYDSNQNDLLGEPLEDIVRRYSIEVIKA